MWSIVRSNQPQISIRKQKNVQLTNLWVFGGEKDTCQFCMEKPVKFQDVYLYILYVEFLGFRFLSFDKPLEAMQEIAGLDVV